MADLAASCSDDRAADINSADVGECQAHVNCILLTRSVELLQDRETS